MKKIHHRDSKADVSRQKKVSVNFKIGQWKLSSRRKRKTEAK